jgi:CDP-6-deoxy-D-xylo-4-hexulose-3-dehydrase
MRISYSPDTFDVYGEEEIQAVVDSLRDGWLAPGKRVKEFEEKVAKLFGKKYGVMVNSGSSANLLAAEELQGPVVTPALTFVTTYSYLKQPVLKDVEEGTYQIKFGDIPPDNFFVPNLLGNIPDWKSVKRFNTVIVEDSCDVITDAGKNVSDITTTSFYSTHMITAAGAGGMIMCNDANMYERFLSKRAWGRPVVDEKDFDRRFAGDYDLKFLFENKGHNLQPIELQAAFGLVQLEKLDEIKDKRWQVFGKVYDFFEQYEDRFILPISRQGANWMNFPLTIREGIDRKEFCRYLEENDIQTRPIFSGNITRQPAFKDQGVQDFPVADKIMKDGILLGCHQGLTDDHLDYMFSKVKEYLDV